MTVCAQRLPEDPTAGTVAATAAVAAMEAPFWLLNDATRNLFCNLQWQVLEEANDGGAWVRVWGVRAPEELDLGPWPGVRPKSLGEEYRDLVEGPNVFWAMPPSGPRAPVPPTHHI